MRLGIVLGLGSVVVKKVSQKYVTTQITKGEIIFKLDVDKLEKYLENPDNKLVNEIKGDYPNIDLDNVFITHAIAPESCKYLEEELPKVIDASKVRINVTQAGCVISSHCGRGTIGILYIKN